MGLMQQAYQTYCMMEKRYAGVYEEGRQPLAPVSHLLTTPAIEITLDRDGNFINAAAWEKNGGKIIIPVTEESAGRTSNSIPQPHPLCEQLVYLDGKNAKKYEAYVNQLQDWASSEWNHPKLVPILHYVKSKRILADLAQNGLIKLKNNVMVCWRVLDPDSDTPPECWRDQSLFRSFVGYYFSMQDLPIDLCMVSGQKEKIAQKHPKGVVPKFGNAKIISANDESGFTYRGRFTDKRQAATVGYTVSQKAHAALRWLVSNEGRTIGGRTFLCWSPQGVAVPQVTSPFLRPSETAILQPSDYRLALRRWKSEEPIGRTLKFVVPAAALKEAEKILDDTDEACTFFLGSKHILFTIGEATLVCRLLEGEFLDWRRVLPQNQPVKLAVNVAKMTDSIERVGLIISEKLKSPVRCKFGENTADFRSVSTIGEAHDVCQIAGDGQDMEIGFNCRYLLDALRAIPDAECSLELINGLSPIVMNPCDGSERYSYMVLPVRLKAGE